MNKAKLTYRYDIQKQHLQKVNPSAPSEKVIPLHPNEAIPESHSKEAKPQETVHDTQSLNQFTTDFGAWSSPFDVETEKLEQLIRNSSPNERSRSKVLKDPDVKSAYSDFIGTPPANKYETFKQSGPDISEIITERSYANPSGSPWGKMILSATGAVLTGILLGSLILNWFSGKVDEPPSIGDVNRPAVQVPSASTEEPDSDILSAPPEEASQMTADRVVSAVNLPVQQYYFLQNGVFSSLESAEAAQLALKENGFASILDTADGYRVYAGFSNERDDALYLSHRMESYDLETYIKPIQRPAVALIEWPEGEQSTFETYLQGSSELISLMTPMTSKLLRQPDENISDQQWQQLQEQHQTWLSNAAKLDGAANEQQLPLVRKMNAQLTTAIQSFAEYKKNANETYLWQAQSAMMHYIFLESEFLQSVTPQV